MVDSSVGTNQTNVHFVNLATEPESISSEAESVSTKFKQIYCKSNGWGYSDTSYRYNKDTGNVEVTGSRYLNSGHQLPRLTEFASKLGLDLENVNAPQNPIPVPKQVAVNEQFLRTLRDCCSSNLKIDQDPQSRLVHGHGHAFQEVWTLRHGQFERLPDAIVYPTCTHDVEKLVQLAVEHDVCLIPYGGGTTVTLALACPTNETRMIVSVDMSEMQRVIYVDVEGLVAKVEAGIVGANLERELKRYGVTMGHEPDSHEFSTLGGWVATNCSGMKKNVYGNIEDVVIDVTIVTPIGTLSRQGSVWPRVSSGPDVLKLVLGSEGIFGIITDATIVVRPIPEVSLYDCLVFPNFEQGTLFMRSAARERLRPAALRLMDNDQTQLGLAVKPTLASGGSTIHRMLERVKTFYITTIKGMDPTQVCSCTILYEGSQETVEAQQQGIGRLASQFGAFSGGGSSGRFGHQMTFAIAYIRDFVLDHYFLAESFELSIPWEKVSECISTIKKTVYQECDKAGVLFKPLITTRITQIYDTGACLYFYLCFCGKGLNNPVEEFSAIEHNARQAAMDVGASISHHHGVGKLRKAFLPRAVGDTALVILRGLKHTIDPKNIFGNQNLI